MADQQLDSMLQEQGQTPASQAQIDGQQPDPAQQTGMQQTVEEVEFNKLSGSTQDRIRELVKRAKDAEVERDNISRISYAPPAPQAPQLNIDQKSAIETLSNFGIATDDKVQKMVDERLNVLRWEAEQNRLESKYTGDSGEPKYDRKEVEDFIISHPQYRGYAPEDVFKFKMYPDEFNNLASTQAPSTGSTSTFRPTKGLPQTDTFTPEYIEQRLKQPDGQQWYEENLEKINETVSSHTKKFNNFGQMV